MDGIHDLGGRQGFGRIEVDEPEEQFHEQWEARVRGMVNAVRPAPDWSLDWFRHCRELIDPADYLTRPYFDQWLQTYAAMLINSGVATVTEIASGKSAKPADASAAPMSAQQARKVQPGARRYDADIDAPPAFASGDAVRARTHGITTHTRLPGYVRGRAGSIERHHGAHILPDANALGEKRHEHLYTVGFDAAELWPEARGRRERIYINLWESYLEPA